MRRRDDRIARLLLRVQGPSSGGPGVDARDGFPVSTVLSCEGDGDPGRRSGRADRPSYFGLARRRGRRDRDRRIAPPASPRGSRRTSPRLGPSRLREGTGGARCSRYGGNGGIESTSPVRRAGPQRARHRGRRIRVRRRNSDGVGGPLPVHERETTPAGLVQPCLNGERAPPGDRGPARVPGPGR